MSLSWQSDMQIAFVHRCAFVRFETRTQSEVTVECWLIDNLKWSNECMWLWTNFLSQQQAFNYFLPVTLQLRLYFLLYRPVNLRHMSVIISILPSYLKLLIEIWVTKWNCRKCVDNGTHLMKHMAQWVITYYYDCAGSSNHYQAKWM